MLSTTEVVGRPLVVNTYKLVDVDSSSDNELLLAPDVGPTMPLDEPLAPLVGPDELLPLLLPPAPPALLLPLLLAPPAPLLALPLLALPLLALPLLALPPLLDEPPAPPEEPFELLLPPPLSLELEAAPPDEFDVGPASELLLPPPPPPPDELDVGPASELLLPPPPPPPPPLDDALSDDVGDASFDVDASLFDWELLSLLPPPPPLLDDALSSLDVGPASLERDVSGSLPVSMRPRVAAACSVHAAIPGQRTWWASRQTRKSPSD